MDKLFSNFTDKSDCIDIHKMVYNGNPLYLVHSYKKNENNNSIEAGEVFMIYKDPSVGHCHNHDKSVLEYKLVHTIQGFDYIELSNIFIDEEYRRKGIGSMVLKYFETKIIDKYFANISLIKGIMLLGEENVLKKFYIQNGYEIQGSVIKKKVEKYHKL